MTGRSGRSQAARASETVLTPANVVTLCRILLVPVFVVASLSPWPEWFGIPDLADAWKSLIAALIFVIISCTDWIDGYLARSRGQVTDFGKFMDPLADKILVAAALLALVEQQVLPSWPVLIILAREFIVSGVRMVAASKGEVIAASWYGKAKTVLQILAIVLFLVKDLFPVQSDDPLHNPLYIASWMVMIAALILTVVSMVDYLVKARGLLGIGDLGARRALAKDDVAVTADDDNGLSTDHLAERVSRAAAAVVDLARSSGSTIGTAESLTGGMIASALTSQPGSSAAVRGGIVSYASEVKRAVLGVDGDVLARCGAVDEQVARQMALGARRLLEVDAAVAVTGIAGPSGAEPGKPLGTVWMAVASAHGCEASLLRFEGGRETVRQQTVLAALEGLLDVLGADREADAAKV